MNSNLKATRRNFAFSCREGLGFSPRSNPKKTDRIAVSPNKQSPKRRVALTDFDHVFSGAGICSFHEAPLLFFFAFTNHKKNAKNQLIKQTAI